jgi:uncharacterized integral membrane protein
MTENDMNQVQAPVAESGQAESPESEPEEEWQPLLWSKLIALVVLVGYGIALVVANTSKVKISFLFASINVSKIWLILLCLVLGLLSGVLISQMYRHRKAKLARLERQVEQANKP